MVRVGIAGCGWAGERHYDAVAASDRATVAAIAEADDETRERRAQEWGVDAFADYAGLYAEADLDAVVIALPHHLHEAATVEAVGAGLDVLCEKPIARTLEEADAMIDAAEGAGRLLMVAESACYEPWTRAVERQVSDGAIGHPVFADVNWLHDFGSYGYDRSEWLNDPDRLGGGSWILNGIHVVARLRRWFDAGGAGAIDHVFAREFHTPAFDGPAGIEGNVGASLGFDGGETASVRMALEVPHHDRFNAVRLYGTEGAIVVDHDRSSLQLHREGDREVIELPDEDPFPAQFAHFLDCLRGEDDPRTPGRRERDTLAVIRAGYDSMESGTAAPVDRREDDRTR